MRVLLLTNAFARVSNGPAKFAHYLLQVAERCPGHEVRILTEDYRGTPEAEAAVAAGQVYGLDLRIPRWAKPVGQWLRMKPYYQRALEVRTAYPWDVLVYINAFQGYYALGQGQVPVLGMINDYLNCQATPGTALRGGQRGLKQYLFKQMERSVARRMPLVMTNSQYLTRTLASTYGVSPERLPTLYKAVDAAPLPYRPNRPWPAADEPWRILFVKTDYRCGGLVYLAQALARLPQHRFVVELVGPPAAEQATVEGFFAGLAHVETDNRGPLPQAALRERLYAAHVFCVPSIEEALGVANMEAALAGTPVVSTTTGGIPEVLDEGRGGFLAAARDPDALAQALHHCMADAAERALRQAHARAYVEATFALQPMLERFMALCGVGLAASRSC